MTFRNISSLCRYLVVSSRAREEIYQFVGFRQLDVKNGFNTTQMLISFTKAPYKGEAVTTYCGLKIEHVSIRTPVYSEYKQM